MDRVKGKVGSNLTEGNILKLLMIYVLPLLLANFLQQLYNSVDTIVIGHFAGNVGTVGVSVGGEIAKFITYIATAFGSAGQIYISQLYGAGEKKKIKETIGTELTLMMGMAAVGTVISLVFCEGFLNMLNTPPEARSEARSYMIIASLGLPAIFGYNAVCGALRGMGESKRPLMFVFISAVSNVFLDLLLVAVIPLSSAGTAIATVIAQYASFIASLVFMHRHKEHFDFDFKLDGFRIKKKHVKVLLELGIPLTAQSVLIHATQLYGSAKINDYGLVPSATYNVGNKIYMMINVITQSISTGAGAMVGQCLGAKKPERARKVVYITLACTCTLAVIQILVMLFLPRQVYRLFTKDAEVVEFGVTYLRILMIATICSAFQGPYHAVITGSGFASLGFISGVLDGVVLRLGFMYLLVSVYDMGVTGYFYANALAHLGPLIVNVIYFYSGKWKTRRLLTDEKKQEKREKLLAE